MKRRINFDDLMSGKYGEPLTIEDVQEIGSLKKLLAYLKSRGDTSGTELVWIKCYIGDSGEYHWSVRLPQPMEFFGNSLGEAVNKAILFLKDTQEE